MKKNEEKGEKQRKPFAKPELKKNDKWTLKSRTAGFGFHFGGKGSSSGDWSGCGGGSQGFGS